MKIDTEIEMVAGENEGEIRGHLSKAGMENIDLDAQTGEMKEKGPIVIGEKESVDTTTETNEKGIKDGAEVAVTVEKNTEKEEKEVGEEMEKIVVRQQEIPCKTVIIEEENRRYKLLLRIQKHKDREWCACQVKKGEQ